LLPDICFGILSNLQEKEIRMNDIKTSSFWRWRVAIFLSTLIILGSFSLFVQPQSTIDASYYQMMVDQLASGKGFTEPVVWHYLNQYDDLEHPMDYWLPLGIIFYKITRYFAGEDREVWINFIIWSILATLIFVEVLKVTGKVNWALLAVFAHIFHGRNFFYLFTTDNFAFSAILGFMFFRSLNKARYNYLYSGLVSGLLCLLRIEGILIAAFGLFCLIIKKSNLNSLLIYVVIVMCITSPWIFRNLHTLNKPWTSNTKALFLNSYQDFFNDGFEGNCETYFAQPLETILRQKYQGFLAGLSNLVIVPAQFLLFPLLFVGIAKLWGSNGCIFCALLSMLWAACTLLFPVQAQFGTAMHISSFFYPDIAIFIGIGSATIAERFNLTQTTASITTFFIAIWFLFTSLAFCRHFVELYNKSQQPYKEALSGNALSPTDRVVSSNPILTNILQGCKGALASGLTTSSPEKISQKYDCNVIITDTRDLHKEKLDSKFWLPINSHPIIRIYKRSEK